MSTTTKTNTYVANAVQAFREAERARLLLDKKEKALREACLIMANKTDHSDEDLAEYFELTNEVVAEYEVKRTVAGL